MLYKPTRKYENRLRRKGYIHICGIDEAGRGAWAGPIVAACVVLPLNTRIRGIRDSKLLSPKKREEIYAAITNQAIAYSAGVVPHDVIDRIGILKANQRAMEKALTKLSCDPDYVLIDGTPFWKPKHEHEFIVAGDRHITSVAAASIIAKVTRDEIMRQYDAQYPEYGFADHKGYGTREHKKNLDSAGLSPVHRKSYRPIATLDFG